MGVANRREIGQLLFGGVPGASIPQELRALGREFDVGGITLFTRNITSPEQVADFTAELQSLCVATPMWMCVDQEGGRVARLGAPFTVWPPMRLLGRSGEPALARRFARALAAELRAVGITLDFAPVLDVDTNPKNPVIGDRSLSDQPEVVGLLGAAIVSGLQEGKVAACGKHFPGHGDTVVDSHQALPVVERSPDRLRQVEAVPFLAAMDADVAFIMTAHVLVPSLDGAQPATLSSAVLGSWLRQDLGFKGVIVSDDLEMKAIADRMSVGTAAVKAIAAGCDGVLVCSGDVEVQANVLEALVHGVEQGEISFARLEEAKRRLRAAKARFLSNDRRVSHGRDRHVIGCDDHRRLADELAAFA